MRGADLFEWRSFGDAMVVGTMPDGALRVRVETDDASASVILPTGAVAQLVDQLEGHGGCVPEDDLAETEAERDTALERVRELEGELKHRLAEIETLKSALAIVDDRQRALEARS